MSLTGQHILLIIIGFLVILLIAAVLRLSKYQSKKGSSKDEVNNDAVNIPNGFVSKEKHNEILKERDKWYKAYRDLRNNISNKSGNSDYNKLQDDEFEKLYSENEELKNRIEELTRSYNELNELYTKFTQRKEDSPTQNKQEKNDSPSKKSSQIIRYASFPRSAGSNSYFSDLTESLADDSYFELKISEDTGEAIFRPLDFMKIRNYDPAMAAMTTEGVKPNMASTILGIEPGKAHLEGKDWIIDKPATIKLA